MFHESFVSQPSKCILGIGKRFRPLSLRSKFFENPGGKGLLLLFGELGSLSEGFFKAFNHYSHLLSLPRL